MSSPPTAKPTQEKEVTLYIGGVHAADGPVIIKTLLGSCISVCLYDPLKQIGGMNHFMLPRGGNNGYGADASRFGVHAMDLLIGAMLKLGASRPKFVAKVFGGAHVLNIKESANGVPQQNIEFIRTFLQAEGFPVLAEDTGGYYPRHVRFFTQTGRVLIKRVVGENARRRLIGREEKTSAPSYGDITLFD